MKEEEGRREGRRGEERRRGGEEGRREGRREQAKGREVENRRRLEGWGRGERRTER